MKVLVVDVGGTHVKMLATGGAEPRRFDSGGEATPDYVARRVRELSADWSYDVVALGVPTRIGPKGPIEEPGNLAPGWVGRDFQADFGRPIRVVNDAAMQALGAYDGGRMLFLGLGTGLGSTLVADRVLVPLELGDLPDGRGGSVADRLGRRGLESRGKEAWMEDVHYYANVLRDATAADYVVLGGGHADLVDPLPDRAVRGGNDDAFTGGFRLWEESIERHDAPPSPIWRVVG